MYVMSETKILRRVLLLDRSERSDFSLYLLDANFQLLPRIEPNIESVVLVTLRCFGLSH